MLTRSEEFQEVRRLLGRPKYQCPDADMIFSALFAAGQNLMNRANETGRVWAYRATTVTTVAGQNEYLVPPDPTIAAHSPGKPYVVYQTLNDGIPLALPIDDYVNIQANPLYEFTVPPSGENVEPSAFHLSAAKVAFYRKNDGQLWMRILPTPASSGIVYTIGYAEGRDAWSEYEWTDNASFPEHTRLKSLQAALSLIPHCKWEGNDSDANDKKQMRLESSLEKQYLVLNDAFERHINNINHEPMSDTGYWWEKA